MSSTKHDGKIKPLDLSQGEVRALFRYRDGKLYRKVGRKSVKPGDLAGCITSNGYWRITINGRSCKRSRLVWLYIRGTDSFPYLIDHINRIRDDDRIENLRLVTHGQNQSNRSWGKSKSRYVYCEGNRWRARVSTKNGRISLGRFSSEKEAIETVRQWEKRCG